MNSILYHLMALIKNRSIIVGGEKQEKITCWGFWGAWQVIFLYFCEMGGLEPFDFFEYEEGGA